MKIVDIKTYVVENPPTQRGGNWILLKLLTDEGIEGIGEASLVRYDAHVVVQMLEDMFKQFVLGFDPFNIEKLYQTLYGCRFTRRPGIYKGGHN